MRNVRVLRAILIPALAMALLAGSLAVSRPVRADVLWVTNTNDSGSGSLRQAIVDANDNPGPDTIRFDIPGCVDVCLIAITLVALDIRLPTGGESPSNAQLLDQLLGLWPKYLAYGISFLKEDAKLLEKLQKRGIGPRPIGLMPLLPNLQRRLPCSAAAPELCRYPG